MKNNPALQGGEYKKKEKCFGGIFDSEAENHDKTKYRN